MVKWTLKDKFSSGSALDLYCTSFISLFFCAFKSRLAFESLSACDEHLIDISDSL